MIGGGQYFGAGRRIPNVRSYRRVLMSIPKSYNESYVVDLSRIWSNMKLRDIICFTLNLLPTPYGSLPTEKISHVVTPNDHTSLLIGMNSCRVSNSSAIHLIGKGKIESSFLSRRDCGIVGSEYSLRDNPKSDIFVSKFSVNRMLRAAKSP